MTTSDKRPRRTTKSAKAAKTSDSATKDSATNSLGIAQTENGGVAAARAAKPRGRTQAAEARPIKAISISVTSRHREDRQASIALAAYFRSESRGFAPGHEIEDWLAAEEEVDQRLLGEGRVS
jgi:hypothetical protein